MDNICVVCTDVLEWVAYRACGHKEVCSTCVARLRFIYEDCCCCICKFESNVVFVTKVKFPLLLSFFFFLFIFFMGRAKLNLGILFLG